MPSHSKIYHKIEKTVSDFDELRLKKTDPARYQQFTTDLTVVKSIYNILNRHVIEQERLSLLNEQDLVRALRDNIDAVIECINDEDYKHFLPVLAYIIQSFKVPESDGVKFSYKDIEQELQQISAYKKSINVDIVWFINVALGVLSATLFVLSVGLVNPYLLIPCALSACALLLDAVEYCAQFFSREDIVDDYQSLCGSLNTIGELVEKSDRVVLSHVVEDAFANGTDSKSNRFFAVKPLAESLTSSPSP